MAKAKKTKKTVKRITKKTVKKAASKSKTRAKKVHHLPKGYNTITPYLIVKGAANAIEFYKKVFGAKNVMSMEKPGGKIGHAELQIGDTKIMLADEHPELGARAPESFGGSPVSIHLYMANVDDVIERAVNAGAKLLRPATNMFYGDRSGGVQDPFGHVWYVATHVEDVSMAEMKKRMAAMKHEHGDSCSHSE